MLSLFCDKSLGFDDVVLKIDPDKYLVILILITYAVLTKVRKIVKK